jgi:hypothetical protein
MSGDLLPHREGDTKKANAILRSRSIGLPNVVLLGPIFGSSRMGLKLPLVFLKECDVF